MPGKVVIITGAGRGIGRATALELSERGWDCVLVARSREQLDGVARELRNRSAVVVADVATPASARTIVDAALKSFGRLDAVVNNAGLAPMASIDATTDEMWRDTFAVNVDAAFRLVREAWPHLKSSRGSAVNISSEAARDPFDLFTAYAPAKAALNALTQIIHRQGKPLGIRAYAVAPSMTDTQMLRDVLGKDPPRDETLKPEDVARVIAECIDGRMRHSSGETIWVHR
jgi:meso-butanediol dehydrogenase/(S,S)-butanediol dehydrogenase/diacetyl reductase